MKKNFKPVNLSLNRYQVQVYDCNEKMIHLSLYCGFTAEQAIEECKKAIFDTIRHSPDFPIKFHTTEKQ